MPMINLEVLTHGEVRSLAGHNRGLAARQKFGLDALDNAPEAVIVRAPGNLDALTPSFVQGLFAASVHALGEGNFYSHYRFELPPDLVGDVRLGVDRILMSRVIAGAA